MSTVTDNLAFKNNPSSQIYKYYNRIHYYTINDQITIMLIILTMPGRLAYFGSAILTSKW